MLLSRMWEIIAQTWFSPNWIVEIVLIFEVIIIFIHVAVSILKVVLNFEIVLIFELVSILKLSSFFRIKIGVWNCSAKLKNLVWYIWCQIQRQEQGLGENKRTNKQTHEGPLIPSIALDMKEFNKNEITLLWGNIGKRFYHSLKLEKKWLGKVS